MSPPELVMLIVVLLSALALRNPTVGALIVYYLVAQGTWLLGIALTTRAYFLFDLTVIALIYCKAPAYDCFPYRDWKHQLRAALLERSYGDRIVIATFPAMWAAYALPLSDYSRWWALYYLALAQFVAASGEALQTYLSSRSAKAGSAPDIPPSGLRFTLGWRWGYG